MISKTHIRDVIIGVFGEAEAEYHVRLFGDKQDGELYWVDFQIYQVVCADMEGRKEFNRLGSAFSPDPVSEYDDAQPIAEGHVKWDGCMEVDLHDGHTCSRDHLRELFAAIERARELAAAEMPHHPIGLEYA